jgi:hypothetical protein
MRQIVALSIMAFAASASALASVDDGLLNLVPGGAKIVTSIDADRARSSDFGQYMLNRVHTEDQNFEEFIQQTGFDPRRDLQHIVFAVLPNTNPNEHSFAVVARGNFDTARLEAAAIAKGAVVQPYQGVDLILDKSNNQKTGFAFPDVGVAVMADGATLRQIIANRATPSTLDAGLLQEISQVGPNSDVWFVSTAPSTAFVNHLAQHAKRPLPNAQALESVLESSGGIRFGNTVDLSFDAITRSAQDAVSLADVVRFLASMVQMQRQNDPRAAIFAAALDDMKLASSGNAMRVSLSIPEKSLEQLAELGPGPGHRGRH